MAKRKVKVISYCKVLSAPNSSVWWYFQVGSVFPVVHEHKTAKEVEVMIDGKGIWPKGKDERNYCIPLKYVEIIPDLKKDKAQKAKLEKLEKEYIKLEEHRRKHGRPQKDL